MLDAIQSNGGTPILQLHDLQGNIVGTMVLSETEAKLLSTHNSTEFGVPTEGKAPSGYTWLGADGVSSELASGVVTKGGASYVPQLATEIQTQPVTPVGERPNGSYSGSPYTTNLSPEAIQQIGAYGAGAPERHAAEQPWWVGEDPPAWEVLSAPELRALAKEVETDAELVQEDAIPLEPLPGSAGFVLGAVASVGTSAYQTWAFGTAWGLMGLATVINNEEKKNLFPRRYLMHISYLTIKNLNPGVSIRTGNASLTIITGVTEAYCKNEGVWGSGESWTGYTTYYNCGQDGIWGVPGEHMWE